MFLQDSDVVGALTDLLKQSSVADLPAYAPRIAKDCHVSGYNEIVRQLAARGFTTTQIAAWDSGAEFERDLSLWWCLIKMAGLRAAVDPTVFQSLDRRNELKVVPITNSGAPIRPTGGINSVGSGQQSDANQQFFYEVDGNGQPLRPQEPYVVETEF